MMDAGSVPQFTINGKASRYTLISKGNFLKLATSTYQTGNINTISACCYSNITPTCLGTTFTTNKEGMQYIKCLLCGTTCSSIQVTFTTQLKCCQKLYPNPWLFTSTRKEEYRTNVIFRDCIYCHWNAFQNVQKTRQK